jgi:integrase
VSLEIEDLIINRNDESLKLKLRKSKTDPHGMGKKLYLSNEAQQALKEWIYKSKISSGKIFRAITVSGKIKDSLNSSHVGRIYKKIARLTKIENSIIKIISGHSMRVGAAQDLMMAGTALPIIMNRGRWSKIDTVMRYIELNSHFVNN